MARINTLLNTWKAKLGIHDWRIYMERISTNQVSDDDLRIGHQFVGICPDHTEKKATIYHTRKLKLDDLVHELLHVKFPMWSEEKVNSITDYLLQNHPK
jgi:hypothetical protein